MEGDPEESEEDVQGQDKSTVLWERSFQQSIFVDISDDESLHLSDLESSLALHFSKAESVPSEASIHLSGSAELSALDDTSSDSITVSSKRVKSVETTTRKNILHVSSQRPNIMQDELPLKQGCEDVGQDTSDEDQEDLPYDGNLGSHYFNQTASSEGRSEGGSTVQGSPELPGPPELLQEESISNQDMSFEASRPSEAAQQCPGPLDINHLLLQHFSQEELLLQRGRLIEAETLPEVSLLESVDNSVLSVAPTLSSTEIQNNHTDNFVEGSNTASKNEHLEVKTVKKIDCFTSDATDKNVSSSTRSNQSTEDVSANAVNQRNAEKDDQNNRAPLVRTRSFSEMKYGQGQVHYPLPDFSKVAPKVKIPKASSGAVRFVSKSPKAMHKAHSSPGMLDVISRVLEDSVQPSEKLCVFKDNNKQTAPTLVQHLQAEYDKLLSKFADAERRTDEMRLGANTQLSPEHMLHSDHNNHDDDEVQVGTAEKNLSENQEETPHYRTIKKATTDFSNQCENVPSDGETMTVDLRDVIRHFMEKVEEFKCCVGSMATSTAEQQTMLRSMMEAQDQLERKYISKKEEHRALEMQNYMGLSRNTGTFDPNRLVEGDIFRIGMHLEDIKEMIDKNVFEQISPPHSSSTPTPAPVSLHANTSPQCTPLPSPPPCLHECFRYSLGVRFHCGEGTVFASVCSPSCLPCFRDVLGSLEGLDIQAAVGEEGSEDVIAHSDILAYLSGTSSASKQRQRPANSECDLGDCVSLAVELSFSSDVLRDSGSQSISEPPLNTTCVSQRIISPETDSGFGSSYLNHSASGSLQPNLLRGSVQSQSEGSSSSDCDGSCSNLQTEIHSDILAGHQWASPRPCVQTLQCGATTAVEVWVESTTKETSVRQQGEKTDQTNTGQNLPPKFHHHVSELVSSTTMDAVGRHSPLHSCSCNSEAILALQSEVSRLKKDLEEGLIQLPRLAQRMDYLTSKYRRERQGGRSKARTHQTTAGSGAVKSSSRGVSTNSCTELRTEDWISSDMDPSRSTDTDSAEARRFNITLQVHESPLGSRRGARSVFSEDEFQDQLQQSKSSKTATKTFQSGERQSLPSSSSAQKPLLQVSYGSSSSLPASYKVREPQMQSLSGPRKRSTQSDTALLPNNVYFQQTRSLVSVSSRTASRTSRHRGKKEEDVNRTLDQAIEVARSMQRSADHMARRLSADLAKTQLRRKLPNLQPLGDRRHQAF
ncbi:uncharacterized protein aknad1 [Xenentodon cancila]